MLMNGNSRREAVSEICCQVCSSRNLAKFAAIRRASSLVSSFAAER